eukprot:bmy_18562T0
MGNKQTVFTHEQLEAYQVGVMGRALGGFGSLGFLAQEMGTASLRPGCAVSKRSGAALLFYRYQDLAPQLVPLDYTSYPHVKVPYELIGSMPELKDNPFRQRIAQVFSEDGDGHMTLDNFLDMFSVMSEMAPRDLKAYYAFKIYGTVTQLTRGELSAEEVSLVCEKVLDEADGDHDGRLSLEDFQNMILRAPDFLR